MKVTFEMDPEDLENLLDIVRHEVVKCKYESQTDLDMTQPVKDWMKRHGEYIETNILNKIIIGVEK